MYSVKAVATGRAPWEPRTTGEGPRETPGTGGKKESRLPEPFLVAPVPGMSPSSPGSRVVPQSLPRPPARGDLPSPGCVAVKKARSVKAEVLCEEDKADSGAGLKGRGCGKEERSPVGAPQPLPPYSAGWEGESVQPPGPSWRGASGRRGLCSWASVPEAAPRDQGGRGLWGVSRALRSSQGQARGNAVRQID